MDARAEGQVLGEIAALVIDLDCPRQPAGSALWGSAPEARPVRIVSGAKISVEDPVLAHFGLKSC